MSYAIAQKTNIKPSDSRWLVLAVALHVAVFLVPLRDLPPGSITQSAELVVRLVMGQPTSAPEVEPEITLSESEPVREVLRPKPRVAEILELGNPEAEPEQQTEDIPKVNAARLIGLRETLTDKVPLRSISTSENVQLGELRPHSLPENWKRHAGAEALAPFSNNFNGMVVPEKIEIVDRWVASDGSQNVVVETPNGLKLCGRARASDPMRPYIENVMSFHICGGDGAVPFKFKPRKPLDRDFIDPVAKDTNQP